MYMRKRRLLKPGAKYHVVARANRQEMIFKFDTIKEFFLATMLRAKKKYRFLIFNFCIMENHIHIVIQPGEKADLSKIMQWILSVFARKSTAFMITRVMSGMIVLKVGSLIISSSIWTRIFM